ncbi:delta-1-pyrroline-5-carboxylate dehydrogenase, mitochondrial-like [Octopus vulgaris]|nr:delta-1-pyrroline-5-carboxylate dehydrogenase, mitochondrial isoform X1 [Octopus sinensis]CAI9731036.1 delta-1-pyrroline-5-carboxylate dehydrogenase, mitochondrial-like [Octopus vulgaris]
MMRLPSISTSVTRRLCKLCVKHCANSRAMSLQGFKAVNEPILSYLPGSDERIRLEAALEKHQNQQVDIPLVVGDEEIRTKDVHYQVAPFDHQKKLAKYYYANSDIIKKAIDVSQKARHDWARVPFEEKSKIFLKAADLISNEYRMDLMASTMLGQGKTIIQAEIDCAAELADFYRFNVQFGLEMFKYQPISPSDVELNRVQYRGTEGFWAAITPFNFTAIGAHLPVAPAIVGNVCLWKPSDTAMLSNWIAFQILREAGVPPGVINFLPADGPVFGDTITSSPYLSGINFTGSVKTFKHLWKQVAANLDTYQSYPRLIGECGGKNFHFAHPSGDLDAVVNGSLRSAFEYGGQKCSACSRIYLPESKADEVKGRMAEEIKKFKIGSPLEADSFFSAVIDDKAFERIKGYIDYAQSSPKTKIIAGGKYDDSKGYYIEPTIVEVSDPKDRLMQEEIFGPVLTLFVYPDAEYKTYANLVNDTSPFGLTGAIYALDSEALDTLNDIFRDSVGNYYINDKSTGSIVGQQPFGGSRLSGTNDKAGGPYYLMKFVSIQSIKESKSPLQTWKYPYMG